MQSRRGARGGRSIGGAASSNGGGSGGEATGDDDGLDGEASGGAGGAGAGVPTASDPNDYAGICVDQVNAYRATLGLAPLARWTEAEACTTSAAKSDSATEAVHGEFGLCKEFGQCECPAHPSIASIFEDKGDARGCLRRMWDEGPGGGHYDIMSSKSYTRVACGFHTRADGKVWAVQNYK